MDVCVFLCGLCLAERRITGQNVAEECGMFGRGEAIDGVAEW